MKVYENTVAQFRKDVRAKRLVNFLCAERDDYRNRSAHSHSISITEARECLEYVITVQRKLGVLLDQYRV